MTEFRDVRVHPGPRKPVPRPRRNSRRQSRGGYTTRCSSSVKDVWQTKTFPQGATTSGTLPTVLPSRAAFPFAGPGRSAKTGIVTHVHRCNTLRGLVRRQCRASLLSINIKALESFRGSRPGRSLVRLEPGKSGSERWWPGRRRGRKNWTRSCEIDSTSCITVTSAI